MGIVEVVVEVVVVVVVVVVVPNSAGVVFVTAAVLVAPIFDVVVTFIW